MSFKDTDFVVTSLGCNQLTLKRLLNISHDIFPSLRLVTKTIHPSDPAPAYYHILIPVVAHQSKYLAHRWASALQTGFAHPASKHTQHSLSPDVTSLLSSLSPPFCFYGIIISQSCQSAGAPRRLTSPHSSSPVVHFLTAVIYRGDKVWHIKGGGAAAAGRSMKGAADWEEEWSSSSIVYRLEGPIWMFEDSLRI